MQVIKTCIMLRTHAKLFTWYAHFPASCSNLISKRILFATQSRSHKLKTVLPRLRCRLRDERAEHEREKRARLVSHYRQSKPS